MQWIAPAEKDAATATLEKRLWDAADQFRANSGLKAAEYSGPILGLIFLRFGDVHLSSAPQPTSSSTRRYSRESTRKQTVVLAPTGIAALQVGGATIRSFFGFPPKIQPESDIKPGADRSLYRSLELLIIDEVSMLRCDLLDSIDKFLRKNRGSDLPFGGVQLVAAFFPSSESVNAALRAVMAATDRDPAPPRKRRTTNTR